MVQKKTNKNHLYCHLLLLSSAFDPSPIGGGAVDTQRRVAGAERLAEGHTFILQQPLFHHVARIFCPYKYISMSMCLTAKKH